MKYRQAKKLGMPFFNVRSASELSDAQSLFLHYVELYDWAISLPEKEKPADHVVDDDELFDDWYKFYTESQKAEQRTGKSGAKSHKNVINF